MTKLKVPESAHMRIELNKIDSAGLDNAEALRSVLYDENIMMLMILMKNIGVLRDTARAPKPISQKHAIPCNGIIRYHKIPYHT